MERQKELSVSQKLGGWLWVAAVPVCLFLTAFAAARLLVDRLNGDHPAAPSVLTIVVLLVDIAIPVLLLSVRLSVRLSGDSLLLQLRPFVSKRLPVRDIERLSRVSVDPEKEFGGRGWRRRKGRTALILTGGKLFSFSGGGRASKGPAQAVEIKMKDGAAYVIACEQSRELLRLLKEKKKA